MDSSEPNRTEPKSSAPPGRPSGKGKHFLLGLAVLVLLVLIASAAFLFLFKRSGPPTPEPTEAPWFVDVTDKWGINFTHEAGPTGTYFMPQQVGSGAALFDFDGDGKLDIYL